MYGFITGLLLIVVHSLMVVFDPTMFAGSAILGASLLLPVTGQIVLAIAIRKEQKEFKMKQSFLNLWILSVVAIVLYLTYSFVDYNYIHTDLNLQVTTFVQEQLSQSAQVKDLSPEEVENYKLAVSQGLQNRPTVVGHISSGILLLSMHLFASIILSLIVIKDSK